MRPVITLADGIEVLDTTGDLNAFEYGGGVVYRTPDDDIYWQFWEARDTGKKNFYVFTAPVPADVLSFYDFVERKMLGRIGGMDERELERLSRSRDPRERASLVSLIRDAHGPSSVDPNETSEVLSPWELTARWGDVYGKSPDEVEQIGLDDYVVREQKMGGGYECGRVRGIFLGRFKNYEMALVSIAKNMSQSDGFDFNVFHEHEPGRVERIDWDYEGYLKIKMPGKKKVVPMAFWKNAMKKYIDDDKIKERIRNRRNKQSDDLKARQRSQPKLKREKRVERAREFRKSMEERHR